LVYFIVPASGLHRISEITNQSLQVPGIFVLAGTMVSGTPASPVEHAIGPCGLLDRQRNDLTGSLVFDRLHELADSAIF
jgi:hypothetical protein